MAKQNTVIQNEEIKTEEVKVEDTVNPTPEVTEQIVENPAPVVPSNSVTTKPVKTEVKERSTKVVFTDVLAKRDGDSDILIKSGSTVELIRRIGDLSVVKYDGKEVIISSTFIY